MDKDKLPIIITPGEILREEFMEPGGIAKPSLAGYLGIAIGELNRILAADVPLTAVIADRLAIVFGTTPTFWMDLQIEYDRRIGMNGPRKPATHPIFASHRMAQMGVASNAVDVSDLINKPASAWLEDNVVTSPPEKSSTTGRRKTQKIPPSVSRVDKS